MAPAAERAAAARSLPGPTPVRRPEFDVMRGFVVAGLVVFHSAVVFAAGASWFVKDPRPGPGFTVFLLWGSLWGMPLLFLVSGMSARHAMRTRSAAAFARERLARLLVPFAFGLPVLVPPMFYIGRLGQPAFHQPYWRFWLSFVNVPPSPGGCCRAGRGPRAASASTPRTCGSCTSCCCSRSRCCRYLPTWAARGQAAHQRTGWFRRAPWRRRGAGRRGPHDGRRGGVRTGCQHRRLGTRGVCVPVLVRVPDRL